MIGLGSYNMEKSYTHLTIKEFLEEHCMKLRTGSCNTLGCYIRAGWERGKNHRDFQPKCVALEISEKLGDKQ